MAARLGPEQSVRVRIRARAIEPVSAIEPVKASAIVIQYKYSDIPKYPQICILAFIVNGL